MTIGGPFDAVAIVKENMLKDEARIISEHCREPQYVTNVCPECGVGPCELHKSDCVRARVLGLVSDTYQLTDAEEIKEDGSRRFEDTPFYKEQMAKLASDVKSKLDEVSPAVNTSVDWRVSQLAREMCRAQGHDPDMMVVDVNNAARGPFGSVGASNTVPAWTLYLEAAGGLSGALANG